jgi:hypothetical protein
MVACMWISVQKGIVFIVLGYSNGMSFLCGYGHGKKLALLKIK